MGSIALVLRDSHGRFTSKGFALGAMGLWALGAIGSVALGHFAQKAIDFAEKKIKENKTEKTELKIA